MPLRLHVVDGADKGRVFPLPEAGVITIGSSHKHADIDLNDLYVARIHCELELQEGRTVVSDNGSATGTLVNGQKVRQQELFTGDVVRVGNSHLRLELQGAEPTDLSSEEAAPEEDVPEVEVEVLPEVETDASAATETDAPAAMEADASAAMEADAPVAGDADTAEDLEEAEIAEEEAEVVEASEEEPEEPLPTAHGSAAVSSRIVRLPRERLAELCGHTLGHYHLKSVVSKGYSGVVFQADDLKAGRRIALKVLSPDFPGTDEEMQRFVKAMKILLPLRHANLVSLFGGGKTGPYCWIAMEWVQSESLSEMIEALRRARKIDWRGPYRIAVHVARALEMGHAYGIKHGNVTPKHILWQPSEKVAKLADLGLAAVLHGSLLQKLTLREKIQAELAFVAPEQTHPGQFWAGACDIFSLGVVFYALLTGHLPFAGTSQAETIRQLREAKPVPPTKLHPEIPAPLEQIVLKMLAKDRSARFPAPAHLLAELDKLGEKEGVTV